MPASAYIRPDSAMRDYENDIAKRNNWCIIGGREAQNEGASKAIKPKDDMKHKNVTRRSLPASLLRTGASPA